MSNTKEKNEIQNYSELKTNIENILKDKEPLEKYINTREFELKVTKLASNTKFNDKFIEKAKSVLHESKGDYFEFTLFYILFTWKRRNLHESLKAFYDEFKDKFDKYKILVHIKGMAILTESSQPKILKNMIDEIYEFISQPNSEFSTHVGVLNLYVELVCSYCELKFDERNCDELNDLLHQALKYIDFIINEEESINKKAYQKFYLNKGRILVMLKEYDIGEQEINKAISLIPISQDRAIIVNNYSQYLAKCSMIKAYDLNLKALDSYKTEKIKEVNKYKVDSYKIITLIMAVIGFLLGAVNIFTSVTDTFTLLMVMIAYCGLMLLLVGIVLLSFHFYLKEYKSDKHEKTSLHIAVIIITIGIILFVIPLTLTLLKLFNKI